MAFHEVRFPEEIAYGGVGGPTFHTTVLELGSGQEKRNINWSRPRAEFDVAYGIKTKTEFEELLAFFYAREGKAHGFRYKDWTDFELDRQTIGTTDASENEFQAFKRYSNGSVNYDRPLKKIVAASYTVWVNSVQLTEGVGAAQFQINVNTGVVTIGATHAATMGQAVELACEFDVPVRFDTDLMAAKLEDFNLYEWGQVILKELLVA
jgi:uncharacterized protein (TIGR02217 family)